MVHGVWRARLEWCSSSLLLTSHCPSLCLSFSPVPSNVTLILQHRHTHHWSWNCSDCSRHACHPIDMCDKRLRMCLLYVVCPCGRCSLSLYMSVYLAFLVWSISCVPVPTPAITSPRVLCLHAPILSNMYCIFLVHHIYTHMSTL